MSANVAFSLQLPDSWSDLELDPAVRDRRIAELVESRVSGRPELRRFRASFTAYIRSIAADAWAAGARYCGVFVEAGDDGFVPGAVTVTLLPPAPPGSGTPTDRVLAQIEQAQPDDDPDSWLRTTMAPVRSVGHAPRLYGVQRIRASEKSAPIPVVLMHTFVPVQGSVVLIACASPAVDLANALLDLFDAVTDTFRLHAEAAEATT